MFEAAHREIRRQLQGDVLRMLNDWLRYASKRPEKLLPAACRVHAHIALIFKNVPSLEVDSVVVAGFLSAQAFLNINHRWLEDTLTSGDTGRLGVGEVELFDAFEARRSSEHLGIIDTEEREPSGKQLFSSVLRARCCGALMSRWPFVSSA
eukprot:g24313.t1